MATFSRATGGPGHGRRNFLVGERGPELFTPPSSGNIVPNHQLQSGPPEVNVPVTIVNLDDPSRLGAYLSSTEGEKIIMNTFAKNRKAVGL